MVSRDVPVIQHASVAIEYGARGELPVVGMCGSPGR